jgi:Fur family ferric uptake transcriptional regulator
MDWEDKLSGYLKGRGLRLTTQRRVIAELFFATDEHLDSESLYLRIKRKAPHIGQATVYRTLNLLVESGLASRSNFGGTSARYEVADEDHHDHLICTSCGTIIEFHNEEIESLQEVIAAQNGFTLESHKMELYGSCSKPTCKNS